MNTIRGRMTVDGDVRCNLSVDGETRGTLSVGTVVYCGAVKNPTFTQHFGAGTPGDTCSRAFFLYVQ